MEDHMEQLVKSRVKRNVTKAFKVFFAVIAAIVFVLLFGYVIMWLWNWLMPEIFGLVEVSYWQAVGLLALAKILFGSFGGNHSHKHKSKSREKWKSKNCGGLKNDLSQWKHYDSFWKEEGEDAYKAYIERQEKEKD